jgi:hypothetical protein
MSCRMYCRHMPTRTVVLGLSTKHTHQRSVRGNIRRLHDNRSGAGSMDEEIQEIHSHDVHRDGDGDHRLCGSNIRILISL